MRLIFTVALISLLHLSILALKPDTIYHRKPNMSGLMYKEYKVKTTDGFLLNVWFMPAQAALSDDSLLYYYEHKTVERPYVDDDIKKPTIILCNGDAGNMWPLPSRAYHYCTNGFNVLTFDWRGFGESQYFTIQTEYLVYPEFITDYNSIIDFVKTLEGVDADRIGLSGFSTGAFLSYVVASQRPEVMALVVRGIFTDYGSLMINLTKLDSSKKLFLPEGIDHYSPKYTWGTFTKPIFLVVGDLDKRTPKEQSIEILQNVKSSVRELWIVDKAAHGGVDAPEYVQEELYFQKSIRFFKENL